MPNQFLPMPSLPAGCICIKAQRLSTHKVCPLVFCCLVSFARAHTHTHVHTHSHIFACARTLAHARARARTHTHSHTHTHAHTHTHTYIHNTHTHTHTQASTCGHMHQRAGTWARVGWQDGLQRTTLTHTPLF